MERIEACCQHSVRQQTKTEMVYQYLTGPRFRQRVEAIVEAFSTMQEDLDKERKTIMKQWAKREEQIERVMGATVVSGCINTTSARGHQYFVATFKANAPYRSRLS